jgi:Zn-dependent M32 family carboxypeptidase
VYKSEEERKMKNLYNLPLPFIEKIEELYEALKKEKLGKVSRIIDEIYRQYKEEIYELPSHLQEVFVDIVNSSRHPHYNEKRKKNDLRRLKEVLEELRKYRQRTSSSIYLK